MYGRRTAKAGLPEEPHDGMGQGHISQIERRERRGSDKVLRRPPETPEAPVELFIPPAEED